MCHMGYTIIFFDITTGISNQDSFLMSKHMDLESFSIKVGKWN